MANCSPVAVSATRRPRRSRSGTSGWAPTFLMPAITHCDVMPGLLCWTERYTGRSSRHESSCRSHRLICSLHPCAPSLVPGPESPSGIQTISHQHHPPHCEVMPALVGQAGSPPQKPTMATFILLFQLPTPGMAAPTLCSPRFGTSGWVPAVLTPAIMHCDLAPALV